MINVGLTDDPAGTSSTSTGGSTTTSARPPAIEDVANAAIVAAHVRVVRMRIDKSLQTDTRVTLRASSSSARNVVILWQAGVNHFSQNSGEIAEKWWKT